MTDKDWTGNRKSVFVTLGSSNHTNEVRETHDYYATEPKAVELLLEQEKFFHQIWEPACGEGHISKVLEANGYDVFSTDLVYRGYGVEESVDFLKQNFFDISWDIITNPPYKYALEFAEKSLQSVQTGRKVALFLRLQFLEGKKRKDFFKKFPPKTVYVSSSRLQCAKNGDFDNHNERATAYAWFVWVKGYQGDTVIKWIN